MDPSYPESPPTGEKKTETSLEGVLLRVGYLGTTFAGWAPQPGQSTVAGVLLEAIRAMRPEVREVRGSSRTDAGVHARGQVVAFECDRVIPSRGWVLGLGTHLPPTVAVRSAGRIEAGFVPRFHALGKRYEYTLIEDVRRDPFWEGRAWRVDDELDVRAMANEARSAIGRHDFAAFRGAADERENTERTITRLDVVRDERDPRLVRVIVEGDGFLYNMVRIIAGTLRDVGLGRLDGPFARALESHRRTDLGPTAPPHGLVLDEVFLDVEESERFPANLARTTIER